MKPTFTPISQVQPHQLREGTIPCPWCGYTIQTTIGLNRDSVPYETMGILCASCGNISRFIKTIAPISHPGMDATILSLERYPEDVLQSWAAKGDLATIRAIYLRKSIRDDKLKLTKATPKDIT